MWGGNETIAKSTCIYNGKYHHKYPPHYRSQAFAVVIITFDVQFYYNNADSISLNLVVRYLQIGR